METITALPLSQQIIAWMLQALGLLDDVRACSRSTAKSALRGEIVSQTWDHLLDELLALVGSTASPEHRETIVDELRAFDRSVSALDASGLPLHDRVPIVLNLLIPRIGVRLGLLARIIADLWGPPPLGEDGQPLPIVEWICDLLSPKTFGRLIELLLRARYPAWSPWGDVAMKLERKGVVSRKTVARWREGTGSAPSVSSLRALASLFPEGSVRDKVLLTLRFARAMMIARRSLEAEWADARAAEAMALGVGRFARGTCGLVASPAQTAELADLYTTMLRAPGAPKDLIVRSPPLQILFAQSTPEEAAAHLTRLAERARASGDATPLRPLLVDQLLVPSLLTPIVSLNVGASPWLTLHDAFNLVQGHWRSLQLQRSIARGEEISLLALAREELPPFTPSPGLRQLAESLIGPSLEVFPRREGGFNAGQTDQLRFFFALMIEGYGSRMNQQVMDALVEELNRSLREVALPGAVERVCDDPQILSEAPNLLLHRARRLASEGAHQEAHQRLLDWMKTSPTKRPDSQRLIAEVLLMRAHDTVPRLFELRQMEAQLRAMGAELPRIATVASSLVSVMFQMLDMSSRLLAKPDSTNAAAHRVNWLLPLALLVKLENEENDRSQALSVFVNNLLDELVAVLRHLPAHGESWATLAVIQEVVGQDSAEAVKRAIHFGAASDLNRLRSLLALYL
ncbi:hypothetical protein L6R46_20205 [Myxococcota bacterium]|nr:hypothetical protein [Myxococcota bacterium]